MFTNVCHIKDWLEDMDIHHYKINRDGTVDVHQSLRITTKMTHLPIQFGTIDGSFRINDVGLTTLKGCPRTVKGSFFASQNELTNLKGVPTTVRGMLSLWGNHQLFEVLPYLFDVKGVIKVMLPGPVAIDDIVNKYLEQKDILSCVDALIDAGCYAYCKGV